MCCYYIAMSTFLVMYKPLSVIPEGLLLHRVEIGPRKDNCDALCGQLPRPPEIQCKSLLRCFMQWIHTFCVDATTSRPRANSDIVAVATIAIHQAAEYEIWL